MFILAMTSIIVSHSSSPNQTFLEILFDHQIDLKNNKKKSIFFSYSLYGNIADQSQHFKAFLSPCDSLETHLFFF